MYVSFHLVYKCKQKIQFLWLALHEVILTSKCCLIWDTMQHASLWTCSNTYSQTHGVWLCWRTLYPVDRLENAHKDIMSTKPFKFFYRTIHRLYGHDGPKSDDDKQNQLLLWRRRQEDWVHNIRHTGANVIWDLWKERNDVASFCHTPLLKQKGLEMCLAQCCACSHPVNWNRRFHVKWATDNLLCR